MAAYFINDMDVLDPQLLDEYKKLSPSTVARYGGKFLARGGRCEVLEGTWVPKRLVIIEFPSIEQAKAWSDSQEYAAAKKVRQKASRSNIVVVEGAPPP